MASRLHSISIPESMSEFLEENPEISLSKITQKAISDIMQFQQTDPLIQKLRKQNAALQKRVEELSHV